MYNMLYHLILRLDVNKSERLSAFETLCSWMFVVSPVVSRGILKGRLIVDLDGEPMTDKFVQNVRKTDRLKSNGRDDRTQRQRGQEFCSGGASRGVFSHWRLCWKLIQNTSQNLANLVRGGAMASFWLRHWYVKQVFSRASTTLRVISRADGTGATEIGCCLMEFWKAKQLQYFRSSHFTFFC